MNVAATRDLARFKPGDLPSPPQSCLRVIKEASNPEASVEALGRIIAQDPAFIAELLRTVNSPAYSLKTPVTTPVRAVAVIGWRTLRNLALTFAVREAMKNSPVKGPMLSQFWEHALRRAVGARRLARLQGKTDPEEAFTMGMLLDFGLLSLFKVCPEQVGEWERLMAAAPAERLAAEQEVFGTTHDQVARLLAARWGLPEGLSLAVAFHHTLTDPALPANHRAMARIAHTADLANAVYASVDKMGALEKFSVALEEAHGMGPNAAESFLSEMADEVDQAAGALGLRVARQPSYEEVLAEANRTLMQISSLEQARADMLETALLEKEKLNLELERARAALEQMAFLDPMTGIANRRRFEEVFLTEIARCGRERKPLTLVMLDIDFFKKVNDTFGHPFGDAVIQAVALALGRGTRTYDFQARIGGEEMVLVLSGTDETDGLAIAERVRAEVQSLKLVCNGTPVPVTASFGGVTFRGDASDVLDRAAVAAAMTDAADHALYASKQGGRNRVSWGAMEQQRMAQAS